jgi:hypothetical protein
MTVTEDEAKKMWCPMVRIRIGGIGSAAINSETEHHPYNCAASECMMWRWVNRTRVDLSDKKQNLRGFCGLAGKPLYVIP